MISLCQFETSSIKVILEASSDIEECFRLQICSMFSLKSVFFAEAIMAKRFAFSLSSLGIFVIQNF
jgi:hypothetical protein